MVDNAELSDSIRKNDVGGIGEPEADAITATGLDVPSPTTSPKLGVCSIWRASATRAGKSGIRAS
jgi:hypothetical protein